MKVHFKNLDAIRFIAALLVVLYHGHLFMRANSVAHWNFMDHALKDAGRMGVNLFFVLSGFLISYLLLREHAETGTMNFRNFYIRRILRIWPLYLVFGVALILLAPYVFTLLGLQSQVNISTMLVNLLFLLLFSVNIQMAFLPYNNGIPEITWSVCVEEQFYLIWPLLLMLFRNRLKLLFMLMIGIGFLCKTTYLVLPLFLDVTTEQLRHAGYLLLFDKLELFGTGMFAAYLLFHKRQYPVFFHVFLSRPVQWLMLALTGLAVFSVIRVPWLAEYYYDNFIQAFLFGYLMLMAVADNSILRLENPLLRTLGRISYGIYIFHTSVCKLLMLLFLKVFGYGASAVIYEFMYPLACLVVTCIIAYISYELFEKYFLRVKAKYAVVKTRM